MALEFSDEFLPQGALVVSALIFFLGFINISMSELESRIGVLLGKLIDQDIKNEELSNDSQYLIHGRELQVIRPANTINEQLKNEIIKLQKEKKKRKKLMIGVLIGGFVLLLIIAIS